MQRFSTVWYVLFASLLQAQDIDFGAAEISSQPNGAAVYIEGFLLGTTPVTAPQLLPERSYSLVVRKDGHADVRRDLRVTAGEVAKISIELRLGSRLSAVRDEDDWTPALRGQGKSGETRRSEKRFRSYPTLEIANFLMKADRSVPPTLGYSLLPQLARRLEVKTAFERFVTIYTDGPSPRWSEGGGDTDGPALVLSGVITRFNPGNRASRLILLYQGPFQDKGNTEIRCLVRVSDRATGQILLERSVRGRAGGVYGSSKAVKNLASNIAEVIKANW